MSNSAHSEKKHSESKKNNFASGAQEHSGEQQNSDWVFGEEDFFRDFVLAKALRLNFNYWFFPGLIAHELGHVIGCWLGGSRIAKVVLWSPKGGYVVHQRVRGSSSVLISLGPFFFNNFLATFFLLESLRAFASPEGAFYGFLSLWLGFSFAIYSFPSMHDLRMSVDGLQRSMEKWRSKKDAVSRLLSIIAMPLIYVSYMVFVTAMAIFAAGPGSRMMWFFFLLAVIYSGAFGEFLGNFG